MRTLRSLSALLFALALLAHPAPARGHARSVSWSQLDADGERVSLRLTLAWADRDALGVTRPDEAARRLPAVLRVEAAAGPCAVDPRSFLALPSASSGPAAGTDRFTWTARCPGGPRALVADGLGASMPGHLHLAEVRLGDGRREEHALAGRHLRAELGAPAAATTTRAPRLATLGRFVVLGVEHIAGGADHLVFLLALAVFAASLRQLAAAVTGFTVGHSLTLALAALGRLDPDPRAVEALIGASIVVVAVENVWLARPRRGPGLPIAATAGLLLAALLAASAPTRLALVGLALLAACWFALLHRSPTPARLRLGTTALFGLVHGCGFAAVLRELSLPRDRLALALLGFNGGVELGQLALLAAAWPLLALARRRGPAWTAMIIDVGSAAAAAAGVFWLLTRVRAG